MSGGEQQTTHREEGDFRDQKPGESPEPPIAAYHPLLQEFDQRGCTDTSW